MNYQQATELFNTARNKENGKPIDNNTRLIKTDRGYGIKLYDTVVVEILPDNSKILNSGGWRTPTTKIRINNQLDAKVWDQQVTQSNFNWFVSGSLFYDNMVINPDGTVKDPKPLTDKKNKKQQQLKKKIKAFARKCNDLAVSKQLDYPSAGDCWYCCLKDSNHNPLGDLLKGSDHLLDHLKEHYYVPSLVVNAVTEAGYGNPGFLIYHYPGSDNVYRAVYKYLIKRLLPEVL